MKRPTSPDDLRLWSMVTSTIHPLRGQGARRTKSPEPPPVSDPLEPAARIPVPSPATVKPVVKGPLDPIEPRRHRRIARERDPITAHIDLHGLTQDRARALLESFVLQSWREGSRAVLVITGKGLRGDGILRRMTPEWLASPRLREAVAGVSEAHRQHGGEGALYVALKRRG